MRKKCLISVLTFMLLVSCWGCGDQERQDGDEVHIVFWHSFVASSRAALTTLIAEFEMAQPGIRIQAQYVPTGDALMQKLIAAIQSETAPDLAWIHPDFIDKLATAQSIYPLQSFFDGADGLTDEELDDIYPPLRQAGMWKDSVYALPMEATTLALVYNKDLFVKAGLDADSPPKNWDELKKYTIQLSGDDDQDGKMDRFGFYVPVFPAGGPLNMWMIMQWAPFVWQAGGQLLDPGTGQASFDQAAGIRALSFWNDLYHQQKFEQFSLSHDLGFMSQTVAMVMDGPWNLPRYRTIENFSWGIAPLPAGDAGQITYIGGEHLVIFKQSKHAQAAWKFIKWVVDPQVQARFSINSGYLPVRRSTLDLPTYQAHLKNEPAMAVFAGQLSRARTREMPLSHRAEFNRLIARAIEETVIGKQDPAATLGKAAREVDQLMQKRR